MILLPAGLAIPKLIASSEMVVNGGFIGSSPWTVGSAWAISSGVAVNATGGSASAAAKTLSQVLVAAGPSVAGTYSITFTVLNRAIGAVTLSLGDTAGFTIVSGTSRSANGTFNESLVVASGTSGLTIRAISSNNTQLHIDNVSVIKTA